jgi:UDP-3-O-[3-hydroxymyristoyl] glucosamine N-acyltransferase
MSRAAPNDFIRLLARPTTAGAIHASLLGSALLGDPDRAIRGIGSLGSGADGVLTFCDAPGASERFAASRAAVVIVPREGSPAPCPARTLVAVDDVRAAFIDVVASLLPDAARPPDPAPGVAAGAHVDAAADVAPTACIGARVHIGPRTRVGPGAVVYDDSDIGSDCVIGPGASIGWVGLAYHDRADGRRLFFPHLGSVRIHDRVDVGAQACVCRGMLSHTLVGDDVKIGSLVYVSHGVVIGERAWLSAGTLIAGHARVAAGALLGIGSVVVDNVNLDEGVLVGGGSVVTKHAAAGEKLYGVPAHPVASMRRFGPTPRG